MAYVRINAADHRPLNDPEVGSMNNYDVHPTSHKSDRKKPDGYKSQKPLIIFTFNISFLSPIFRYLALAFGMFFFMCLYGYFQELVVYGWFNRKLSLFCTFLHFLGCSFFAQLQYNYSGRAPVTIESAGANSPGGSTSAHITAKINSLSSNLLSSNGSATFGKWLQGKLAVVLSCMKCYLLKLQSTVFTMGTAPPRLAFGYYLLLVLLKTATQGLTTMCMAHINYPAKVLFKSANPVVTMIFGLVWFGKKYAPRDYIVVLLLVLGLYFFMNGTSSENSPKGTGYGIFLVTLSMVGSAGVPMVQEHCMSKYNASIEELLYHCYIGSTIISFVLAVFSGEFFHGISFLLMNSDISTWLSFAAFCSFGYCGANFGTALTSQFGSLVNGITNTARKAVTLALSFALFPERNTLEFHHVFGGCIFFCGLIVRTVMKDTTEKTESNNFARSKNSEMSISGENRNSKNSAQITDFDYGQSERDYFISTKNKSDSNDDSYVNENGNKNRNNAGDIENGYIKYSTGDTGKLEVIDDYVTVGNNVNVKKSMNDTYDRNNMNDNNDNNNNDNNNSSKNVKSKVKNTTIHTNIHYNGIDSIIVQNTSPPIKRNSPSNFQQFKGVSVGSSNVALNMNSRVVHDEYDWSTNNNSDDRNNDIKYVNNRDDGNFNDDNLNTRKPSNNVKYGKPTVV